MCILYQDHDDVLELFFILFIFTIFVCNCVWHIHIFRCTCIQYKYYFFCCIAGIKWSPSLSTTGGCFFAIQQTPPPGCTWCYAFTGMYATWSSLIHFTHCLVMSWQFRIVLACPIPCVCACLHMRVSCLCSKKNDHVMGDWGVWFGSLWQPCQKAKCCTPKLQLDFP